MKHLSRVLACAFFVAIISCFISNDAWAEEKESDETISITIDCSQDQMAYGEMVSRLIQSTKESAPNEPGSTDGGKRGQPTAYRVVLCRTDGREYPFETWNPRYIIAGPSNCYTLFFDSNAEAEKAVEELSSLEGIRYAELDAAVEACGDTDPTFQSWGAELMNFGPYLSYSEMRSEGSAIVAIIDSGVYLHSMYADRIQESGYDYIDADTDATNDLYGHGTNVAGIVADCTNSFQVYLYPIRVLNASGGGSTSNVVNAIREATEKNVNVINLSLVTKTISEAMDEAVIDAVNAGVTVVAAAGNNSTDTAQLSPAHLTYPGFLVIGAAESDGGIASYSNYGESVDLFAYGTDITCCSRSGGYTTATGTSIAAPHITGLSALLILSHQGINPTEIETRIKNSTELHTAINIPDLVRIIPNQYGFSLSEIRLDLDDRIQLPKEIWPLTAMEPLSYLSSDEDVLVIDDGCLIPLECGTATLTVQCLGLNDHSFSVSISDDECTYIRIPPAVVSIASESFYGDSRISHVILPDGINTIGPGAFNSCENLKTIHIPASVTTIEDNSFSDAIIICNENSIAHEFAITHALPYILIEEANNHE